MSQSKHDEFLGALKRKDWERQVEIFAEVSARNHKLEIVVDTLLLERCNGDEEAASALKTALMNKLPDTKPK